MGSLIEHIYTEDEAIKWWSDLLDRAESGEVVKIKRGDTIFYLGTMKGVSDGQKRVVDAAIVFGLEIGKEAQRNIAKAIEGSHD